MFSNFYTVLDDSFDLQFNVGCVTNKSLKPMAFVPATQFSNKSTPEIISYKKMLKKWQRGALARHSCIKSRRIYSILSNGLFMLFQQSLLVSNYRLLRPKKQSDLFLISRQSWEGTIMFNAVSCLLPWVTFPSV